MGLSTVGAARDDVREGELACPQALHREFELERGVTLAHAGFEVGNRLHEGL